MSGGRSLPVLAFALMATVVAEATPAQQRPGLSELPPLEINGRSPRRLPQGDPTADPDPAFGRSFDDQRNLRDEEEEAGATNRQAGRILDRHTRSSKWKNRIWFVGVLGGVLVLFGIVALRRLRR